MIGESENKTNIVLEENIEKKTTAKSKVKMEEKKIDKNDFSQEKLSLIEKFARSVVLNPCKHFAFAWFIVLVICAFVIGVNWFVIEDFGRFDWVAPFSAGSEDFDAFLSASATSDNREFFAEAQIAFRSVNVFGVSPLIMYEWRDKSVQEDIFTPENLKAICEFEREMLAHPDFSLFCFTSEPNGTETECDLSQLPSVAAVFYQSFEAIEECALLPLQQIEQIRDFLVLDPNGRFFFDKSLDDSILSNSPRTRSIITLAGPLGEDSTGGENFSDVTGEFEDPSYPFYEDFLLQVSSAFDKFVGLENQGLSSKYLKPALIGEERQIEVKYYSSTWDVEEFNFVYTADILIVVFSIVLVGLLVFYHTGSCFISSLGIAANMTSIVVALFFYRGVLQIEYFTAMHVIILFLLVGVGADNIFVFFDSWVQSEEHWMEVSPGRRVKSEEEAEGENRFGTGSGEKEVFVYRMRYTLKVASASIFNTLSTTFVAFLATAVNALAPIAAFGIYASIVIFCNFLYVFLFYAPMTAIHHSKRAMPKCCVRKKKKEGHSNAIEFVLIRKFYLPLMEKFSPWLQIAFVVVNFSFFSLMGIYASRLELPDEIEEFYGENHMYFGIFEDYTTNFAGGNAEDSFVEVQWTFGLSGVDREGFDRFDPNGFRGEATFDDSFDVAPRENQEFIVSLCQELETLSCVPEGESGPLKACSGPDPSLVVFPGTLACVLTDFYSFMEEEKGFDEEAVKDLGDNDAEVFYEHLFNFSLSRDVSATLGFFEGELGFLSVNFFTSFTFLRPLVEKQPVHDILFQLLREKKESPPVGLETQRLAAEEYAFTDGEKTLIPGLFSGLAIAFSFAFVVLLYGTDNIYLSVFAIVSIVGIVVSLLGVIQLLGYSLGYIQTIAAVMVVGLSVDYTVHIGHTYEVAAEEGLESRKERFHEAAERMGPTVVMGFVTTAVSAAAMLFCQLSLFPTMGLLILVTVSFSLEVSLFFYLSLCLLFGPEKDDGKVSLMFKRLFCCKDKQAGDTEKDTTELQTS